MENKVKKVINDIKAMRNLEESLPVYFNRLFLDYYEISAIRLTYNYYTFYEMLAENGNNLSKDNKETLDLVNEIVNAIFEGTIGEKYEEYINKIDSKRKEIISNMDNVFNNSSAASVVEFAINRIEHRFDNKYIEINDEDVVQSVMQYILSDKETVVINDKIKIILGQLPVRMTKSKLYSWISNSLTLYKGSDKSSLDAFIDTIRTSAALKEIDDNSISELLSVDYTDVSKEDFNIYNTTFKTCVDNINAASFDYQDIMGIVNDCYEMLISHAFVLQESDIIKKCGEVITKVSKESIEDSELDELMKLEGEQERLMMELISLENVLFDVNEIGSNMIDALVLASAKKCANTCYLLNSTSAFADLSSNDNADKKEEMADDDYIAMEEEKLLAELSDKLSQTKGLIRRGIMASILGILPIQFKNTNEIMEYVSNSLVSCRDLAEKTAFIEIFNSFSMSEEA